MGMRRLKGNLINLSLVILLSLSGWTGIRASELPKPASKVLLTITGNISRFNKDDSVELDLAMLEQFEQVSFVTETPWTDGPTRFTGVRINQLLEFVGARSNSFRASALDKYLPSSRENANSVSSLVGPSRVTSKFTSSPSFTVGLDISCMMTSAI